VKVEDVAFYSEGERVAGLWRTPDEAAGPFPAIVHGPGWMGLRDAKLYVRYHEALTQAGFGVLVIDYRGFGDSGGDPERMSVEGQVADLVNAVTYLTTREDVRREAIGAFGSGGTGGGNAILLAAADLRVRAVVSQLPVADGQDWLHRMRSEHEWVDFLKALEEDRRDRVLRGEGRLVNPREEIMIPTPERRTTTVKSDVDARIPTKVSLRLADEILRYRPIDAAAGLATPLLVIGIEDDAVTPTDHAVHLYEAAAGPKELVMQRNTTHYAAYDQYWESVTPRIVQWFTTYVRSGDLLVRTRLPEGERTDWLGPA